MTNPFKLNPNESILFRSRPSRQWYMLVWRIGVGILEAFVFLLLSFLSFTNIGGVLLATFLPPGLADGISRVLFQGVVPLLVAAWFAEDTARIFTSEVVLTDQRIWVKGSPYAWTSARNISLADIKSLVARREAVFMRLNDTKKLEVLAFPNGKQMIQAYQQFIGKTGGH